MFFFIKTLQEKNDDLNWTAFTMSDVSLKSITNPEIKVQYYHPLISNIILLFCNQKTNAS